MQVVAYVEALEAVRKARQVFSFSLMSIKSDVFFFRDMLKALSDSFINFGTEDFTTVGNLTQSSNASTKVLEAEQTRSHRRLLAHMNHADEIERQLKIEER